MPDFAVFFSEILSATSQFLLTPPISYFLGITILFFVAGLVDYLIHGGRRM